MHEQLGDTDVYLYVVYADVGKERRLPQANPGQDVSVCDRISGESHRGL
jgi:hypothetical protein